MNRFIDEMKKKALNGNGISPEEALRILKMEDIALLDLLASADEIRRAFKGNKISLCSIVNARSGKCSEDCAFCSQSVQNKANVEEYSLLENDKIIGAAKEAISSGVHKFGIVTSGKGIGDNKDSEDIESVIASLKESLTVHRCASLGILSKKELLRLKNAGLQEYHHNLETSRSFFPEICSTHTYDENVATVRAVKEVGLRICCGGIFGMGETDRQRVELAMDLKDLKVDSIPINFLNPLPGTKMEGRDLIRPIEALKIIVMFRFFLPDKDIKVAGGREVVLKDLQPFMFAAGANSTMLGNYLTTKGRSAADDLAMIKDLGLEPV